jgi:transcriptional regulator with XRE-family HTH domain
MPASLKQLRTYRLRRGYTQEHLGALVGVSGSFISMLEAGKRRGASLDLLVRLAAALGVTPNHLLADHPDEPYRTPDSDTASSA